MNARARVRLPVGVDEFVRHLGLTRAEAEVVRELCQGLSADEIAGHRCVSVTTVRTQLQRAMEKVGAHSQAALVALALRPFL